MARVLVVDDDDDSCRAVSTALRLDGHEAVTASDAGAALQLAHTASLDAVVLDLGLPDLDGLEVCRRLREDGHTLPVLVLTGRGDEADAVAGLDAGADDYMVKPVRLEELRARVRALLRRGRLDRAEANGVRLDLTARRAWCDDAELDLSPKEFDLLALLVRRAGSVLTREQIMDKVWDQHWFGSTKTLDMHISWLRRKLGDDPRDPRRIATVRAVGFRFELGPEAEKEPAPVS